MENKEFEREFQNIPIKTENDNMTSMKSLSRYNSDRLEQIKKDNNNKNLLDVLCDKCGSRLISDNFVLTSIPPKRKVDCSSNKCDFWGYMIV